MDTDVKKILSLILAAVMLMMVLPGIGAFAAEVVDSGKCGDNLTWVLTSDGTLTISGEGEMWDWKPQDIPWYGEGEMGDLTAPDAPWYIYNNKIKAVVIESGVTSIGNFAFQLCSGFKGIIIPEGVTSIGDAAFAQCIGLISVTMPNSVTSIGGGAFAYCPNIMNVIMPNNIKRISMGMFYDSSSLKSIRIPKSVIEISSSAFENCNSLRDVYYRGTEEQWKEIKIDAFNNCLANAKIHYNDDELVVPISKDKTEFPNNAIISCAGQNSEAIHKLDIDITGTATISFNYVSLTAQDTLIGLGYKPEIIENSNYFLASSICIMDCERKFFCRTSQYHIGSQHIETVDQYICDAVKNDVYKFVINIDVENEIYSITVTDSDGKINTCKNIQFRNATDVIDCLVLLDTSYDESSYITDWNITDSVDEITVSDRIELYSTRPLMTVTEGESFKVAAEIYVDDILQERTKGIAFSMEDDDVAYISDTYKSDNATVAHITACSPGMTKLKVTDSKNNLVTTTTISVTPKRNNVYTIYTVPKQDVNEGTLWGHDFITEDNNFYNFGGLFIDSYEYEINESGSCDLSFDVYNTNYTYGIVEVYDETDSIIDAVIIDKYSDKNTSIKESLWDGPGCFIRDALNGAFLSYRQESGYSVKTDVDISNIPLGGYIKITSDPSESLILGLINEIDIVLSTQDTIKAIAGFSKATGKKMFQKFADKLVEDESKNFIFKAADSYEDQLLENIGDEITLNSESIGNFVETITKNVNCIDWESLLISSAVECGISGAEHAFENAVIMTGAALKLCFAIGTTGNLILECHDFVDLINTSAISIQVPDDTSRTYNRVKVQSSQPIDKNVALETYMIKGAELKDLPEFVREKLGAEELVEYINISMMKNGKETQIGSPVTVSVPLSPEMMKYAGKIKIYRVETDGTLTEMKVNNNSMLWADGYVEFTTEHFSVYAIVAEDTSDDESVVPITSDNTNVSFSDVNKNQDFYKAVTYLSENGILTGYPDGTFRPYDTITRAEAATVMVRMLGLEDRAVQGRTSFTDVPADNWASGYINVSEAEGIIDGMGDGTFAPNSEVTYEQIVKMVVCALGYEPEAVRNGGYPSGYLRVAGSQLDITDGVSGTVGNAASRATVAMIIYNAMMINK